jgi:hypothetical protein
MRLLCFLSSRTIKQNYMNAVQSKSMLNHIKIIEQELNSIVLLPTYILNRGQTCTMQNAESDPDQIQTICAVKIPISRSPFVFHFL